MSTNNKPVLCHSCKVRHGRFCSAMDDWEILELDALATRIYLEKDQYLFQEEEPKKYIYRIRDGLAYMERLSSNGRRQIMAFLHPGDFVGLIPGTIVNFRAKVKALGPLTACRWDLKDIDTLKSKNHELEEQILAIGNNVLSASMDQLFVLGCKNSKERLAFFILQMAKRQKRTMGDSETIQLPMRRGDIADYIGITAESVSRFFTLLKDERLISIIDPHEVIIIDRRGLEKIAEYDSA